jgi:hypothetical protein
VSQRIILRAMRKRDRVWLCCGPAIFCLLDWALTLLNQPEPYWAGQLSQAVEVNPPFLLLLRLRPLAFSTGVRAWPLLASSLILWLPAGLARGFSFVVQFAHTLGASTWLFQRDVFGLLTALALFAFSRLVMDLTWQRSLVPRQNG